LTGKLTEAELAQALLGLVSGHEVLRSTFDIAADGHSYQVVRHPDSQPFDIAKVNVEAGEQNSWRPPRKGIDLTAGWPFYCVLAEYADGGSDLFFSVHHVASDLLGADLAIDEIRRILHGSGRSSQTARQPVDLAEYEQSPLGQASNDRAHRNWLAYREELVEHLRVLRGEMQLFETPGISASLHSMNLRNRAGELSAAYGTKPETILITAVSLAFGRIYGFREALFGLHVSNRHLPGIRRTVCSVSQISPFRLPLVPGGTIRETLQPCMNAILRSVRNGHFDQEQRHNFAALDPTVRHIRLNVISEGPSALADDAIARAAKTGDEEILFDSPVTSRLDGIEVYIRQDGVTVNVGASIMPKRAAVAFLEELCLILNSQ
jgi:hypothetical protein